MDARLSRSRIVRKRDPHDWNSYDHYRTIHEKRLAEHPFVDESQPNTLEFKFVEDQGVRLLLHEGRVYCKRGVILEVEKWFACRYAGEILQVKCILYRYVAWIKNGHPILRYHNLHENHDEYHHRVFDPQTGKPILYETLTRSQFPLFSEVLDEIDLVMQHLESSS